MRLVRGGCTVLRISPGLGHGIVPKPAGKRMAAKQPFERQPRPACHVKALDRFVRIYRARGLKPAASTHKQRQICLVKSQCSEREAHAAASRRAAYAVGMRRSKSAVSDANRSEEHTSELQSPCNL